ncbi:MAG TPA: hypothetical protein DDW36_01345 [Candidatus Magasanikbacteria bacterium]|nr:hypothetical protein [Candidatus Magasanikbacteria bacterium]
MKFNMAALRLNVLAPRKKKHIRRLTTFLFLKHIMEIVLFGLCIISVALLLGLYILEENFTTIAAGFAATTPQRAQVRQEAVRINQRINQINTAQKEFIPWSIILAAITELTPTDITWNSWSFDRASGRAKLTGLADNRESVAALEQKLLTKAWVKDVELPLSELITIKEKPFGVTLILMLKDLQY